MSNTSALNITLEQTSSIAEQTCQSSGRYVVWKVSLSNWLNHKRKVMKISKVK